MRRADRLFQIVQHLRGRRLTTAAQLAGWLQISERTVYRDIRDLSLSGVPVEGEAGVGYRLRPGFDLPPIMFTIDEVEALVAGARVIQTWGGPALGRHARSAMAKIAGALPASRRDEIERTRVFAPGFLVPAKAVQGLETVREAITGSRKLHIEYLDRSDRVSRRVVHPLALNFWGNTWSVVAWCESRRGFRVFRLDRISALHLTGEEFHETQGQSLQDFLEIAARENESR